MCSSNDLLPLIQHAVWVQNEAGDALYENQTEVAARHFQDALEVLQHVAAYMDEDSKGTALREPSLTSVDSLPLDIMLKIRPATLPPNEGRDQGAFVYLSAIELELVSIDQQSVGAPARHSSITMDRLLMVCSAAIVFQLGVANQNQKSEKNLNKAAAMYVTCLDMLFRLGEEEAEERLKHVSSNSIAAAAVPPRRSSVAWLQMLAWNNLTICQYELGRRTEAQNVAVLMSLNMQHEIDTDDISQELWQNARWLLDLDQHAAGAA